MMRLVAVADDLSGAAETAAKFLPRSARNTQSGRVVPPAHVRIVLLGVQNAGGLAALTEQAEVLVIDTDNRHRPPKEGAERLAALLHRLEVHAPAPDLGTTQPTVFLKVDSLLRGDLSGQLGVLAESGMVVFAPALPELRRHTMEGIVVCDGIPLDQTDLWHAEGCPPPHSISAAIDPLPSRFIGLEDVRRGGPRLSALMASAGAPGTVVVCDAQTPSDLTAIAVAAIGIPGARLAGASALGAALGVALKLGTEDAHAKCSGPPRCLPSIAEGDGRGTGVKVCVVVGTASMASRAQIRRLAARQGTPVAVDPDELLQGLANTEELHNALVEGTSLVTLRESIVTQEGAARLPKAFAALVAPHLAGHRLVLTGGETARAVMEWLQISELTPLREIEHGAVLSQTNLGTLVVTRPGSFGNDESLVNIVNHLHAYELPGQATPPPVQKRNAMNINGTRPLPVVAVTMGDGAGVGPEVVVAAVLDPASLAECHPVVVGDAKRMQQAADILGLTVNIVRIENVSEGVFESGRINVIDLGLLPEGLPWGKLSAEAGNAAFHYIRVASELAMAGEVQAICTAPLNKEALHMAGHIYPGHTELLAKLTGTEEVSMMLSTPKIKVIHVTTHVGLVDAVRKINPELVERTIRRGHDALIRAGIPAPKIGVCAINPHAGEGGLFGQGEEAEKIEPGVRAARSSGIDVTGPLPADTLFFLAGRGDYDLVVAMYHDQGHGPVKVLGIEAGVNITVGLPVIRTSVDHGTAFDIAGKALADSRSMVEALHQAAQMATRPVLAS